MTESGTDSTKLQNSGWVKENNGNGSTGSLNLRRNNDIMQLNAHLMDPVSQNFANLILPTTSQGNHLFNYQNTSLSGLYSSPGFNSSLGYENNLQWINDNRIQNHHNQISGNVADKSLNHVIPPTTSHSCCVNRFGVRDSLGMGSPLPNESLAGTVKPGCEVSSFPNKTNFAVNMIDPIQTWLNLQIPNNQQYCKYSDRPLPQNYNPTIPVSVSTQMNLPILDQSDLKQNDISMQSPDVCFENINTSTAINRQIEANINNLKQHSFPLENKNAMNQDNSTTLRQQNSYQSSIMSKDWKSTFQSMQNYISSPNMFGPINESQENLYFPQYTMPPSNSYYSTAENYSNFTNKNNTLISIPQSKNIHNRPESNPSQIQPLNIGLSQLPSNDQIQIKLCAENKIKSNPTNYGNGKNQIKEISPNGIVGSSLKMQENRPPGLPLPETYSESLSYCCQVTKNPGNIMSVNDSITISNSNSYSVRPSNHDGNRSENIQNPLVTTAESCSLNNKNSFKSVEIVTSDSDESNIIVEESDDIGEVESEISIEEIKKTYHVVESCSNVILRCLVCNTVTSTHTPASQFVHMNDSFPLTTSSRTPVCDKLRQILPLDLQSYLKLCDSFMCRRCLNLVETVEVLEVKLTTTKKTISDSFSKTVQQFLPDNRDITERECRGEEVAPVEKKDQVAETFTELAMPECVEEETKSTELESARNPSENPSKHRCPYCDKLLSSRKCLDSHLQQHTKEFKFCCDRCDKGFPLKHALQKHLECHGAKSAILCEICGEVFSSRQTFLSHRLKSHGACSHECGTCGRGFASTSALGVHTRRHSALRPFVCDGCGLTFKSEKTLKYHLHVCRGRYRFACALCGKGFVFESELATHAARHEGLFKLTCSLCEKGFDRPSKLENHLRSHSDEKHYKCERCDKMFKTAGNLNGHTKSAHGEERPFKCPVCARTFDKRLTLADHVSSHRNEKPYRCERCDARFAHQTTFITHLKSHTAKVKLKTCQVCGKGIKTRMSVHMRTHTGEKPYKCHHCPLAFTVGISLKKHIENKHSTK